MGRHALRSELAAKVADGWTGAAGRHVLSSEMPGGGTAGRHALTTEVDALAATDGPAFVAYLNPIPRAFSTTHATGTLPGVAGDVLLAFGAGNDQNASLTPPVGHGWTQIGDSGTTPNSFGRLFVFAVVANSTNLAGGTWTWSGNHNHHLVIAAYRGAALPAAASMAKAGTASSINAPSRTSVAADAVMVTYGSFVTNGTTPAWPGTMTTRVSAPATTNAGVMAEEALPVPGATGTRAFTIGGSSSAMSAATVILEPA